MKLIAFSSILVLGANTCFSQKTEDDVHSLKNEKGLHAGLTLGSYFANKYTAKLYDGYGYDADGNRNNFINSTDIDKSSFMYRKIVLEYGGAFGQFDQVAQALGVNHGEWTFDETDMPLNMRYSPAFFVGTQIYYGITQKDALLFNANATKLTLNGNFTIEINTPTIGPQAPGYQNIRTFSITGSEQRLILQMGYRRILGEDDMFNFFVEGGASLTLTKYLNNRLVINNLQIDISSFYRQPNYTTYNAKYLIGQGLGAFAGLGLHVSFNAKFKMQMLYSPSLEKINIGEDPKFKLQQTIGVRGVYNL